MAADESQPASNSVQDLVIIQTSVCTRLSALSDLVLPTRMYQDHGGVPSADQVVSHLTGLLSRDPASFLEK